MEQTLIEKYINENGFFVATPIGSSMWPMLRYWRDNVYLVKYTGGLKKYDLPVYKRPDGNQVMHRCVEVLPNGYNMCGDHQTAKEFVTEEQIFAVAKGFYRDNKYISVDHPLYKLYCRFWCCNLRLRSYILRVMHKMKLHESQYKYR